MKMFTVGPVEMFDAVKAVRAQEGSVPYCRTKEFSALMLETDALLRKFAHAATDAQTVYLTSSGTGAMEATVLNCFTPKDRLLIIDGGTFGHRFCEICDVHGIPYDAVRLASDETLTAAHLEPFAGAPYTGMLVNVHETSTGQRYDVPMLSSFCRARDMFLVVDAISSFLCDPFSMTKSGVDVMIASSQKGACVSPGLSMVVLHPRILRERVMKSAPRSLYFDFKSYLKNFERGQTPFTPAVGVCVELHASLRRIDEIGISAHLQHIADVASDFREKAVRLLPVKLPTFPLSNAITPLLFDAPIAYRVFEILKDRYGILVNPTGGALAEHSLRVAHIGQLDIKDHDSLLKYMQMAIRQV